MGFTFDEIAVFCDEAVRIPVVDLTGGGQMMGSRGRSGWWLGALALALALFFATNPAQARNVPGSVSAVQSRIDQAVASSLVDMTVRAVQEAALFEGCEGYLKEVDAATNELRHPCDWGG